ncbi:MAG: hypothetical protein PSX36_06140 [bacterium]|nr:hypothetical protein [bacterium]
MRLQLSSILLIFLIQLCSAQLPETDVWLIKLAKDKTSKVVLSEPLNITNRAGYDNQPSFSKDGKTIFYVSVRDDKQADIYKYQISAKKITRLTITPESEFSPVQTEDGNFLSSVVVEKDSAQRIHYISVILGLHEKVIDVDSIGYCEFLNADTLLYYKLTQPHSLRFYVNSSKEDKFLGASPVRAFKKVNRHTILFGLKDSTQVTFYTYDFFLRKAEVYATYPGMDEDFIWHSEYGLVKSEGTKLLQYKVAQKKWELLFDLSGFGIKKITRFGFDPKNKYLMVVDNPTK